MEKYNSPKDLLKLINIQKDKLKNNSIYIALCKKYDVDSDIINYIPVRFDAIDVSARTNKGIIILNYSTLNNDIGIAPYLLHEIVHFLQQTRRAKPTEPLEEDTYLDDKNEKEGFKNQVEFISQTQGKDVAENYVDDLLDHHDLEGKERHNKKEYLLQQRKAKLYRILLNK